MVDYTYSNLYYQDSVDKQLKIEVEDGTVITNEDIFSESMTLTESLCSDSNLTFGSCEASKFEIKIANHFTSMKGLWLTVSETLKDSENKEYALGADEDSYLATTDNDTENEYSLIGLPTDEPFVFGRYKVESDKPTADRSFREIVAYDALYDIINADAIKLAEWYNTIFPELTTTMTLKEFRDSFFENFDIEQEKISLPNDKMIVERTIDTSSITGKDIITAICQVNGCFGHIGRDNKFHYIFLPEINDGQDYALGADSDNFLASNLEDNEEKYFLIGAPFGENAKEAIEIGRENWKSINYEDYVTQPIDSLQLRDSADDLGYVYNVGEGGNNYVIENNFLLYGKSTEDFYNVAINIFDKMSVVSYRPTNATLRGNPCFEVGDPILLVSKYKIICTYILTRTLTGIQALEDNYVSNGEETYDNAYVGSSSIIDQLKGISNILKRDVESNTLRIENLDDEYSEIKQTIDTISISVSGGLGSTASIVLTVGDETKTGEMDLSNVRESFANDTSSITISAGTVRFISNTLLVSSDQFTLDSSGNATFSGTLSAPSGNIGGWTIASGALYYGTSSMTSTTVGTYIGTNGIRQYASSSAYVNIQNGIITAYGASISGSITCTSGTIGGWTITSSSLQTGSYNTSGTMYFGSSGISLSNTFRVDSSGQLTCSSGTFSGSISGATGTFTGTVTVTNGNYIVSTGNGAYRIYYGSTSDMMGRIRSATYSSSSYRGFTLDVQDADYGGLSNNGTLYFTVNNGYSSYSQNLICGTTIRFTSSCYLDNGVQFGAGTFNGSENDFHVGGALYATGSLACAGTKYRIVKTENYDNIGMSALESSSAMFEDMGSGIIGEDGQLSIFFDPIFAETIDMDIEYYVFITNTSNKSISYVEKYNDYFIAFGEQGASFDWRICAHQKDFGECRMEQINIDSGDPEIDFNESIFAKDRSVEEQLMDSINDSEEEEKIA